MSDIIAKVVCFLATAAFVAILIGLFVGVKTIVFWGASAALFFAVLSWGVDQKARWSK